MTKRSTGGRPFTPHWLSQPGAALSGEQESGPAPAKLPLFGRLWQRGILSSAVGTLVAEGELDVDRIAETLGNGQPLEFLPRLASHTTRRGAHVLVDRGEGMDPFAEDQEQVVRVLDDILADDRLDVFHFLSCPSRGVCRANGDKWGPWRPTLPGAPVVVLTDLGIGGSALDEDRAGSPEWVRFAHHVHASGHVPIALVPYEPHRWPPQVARAMTVLHWSERTSVGQIRRAMRDSLNRLP